MKDFSTNFLLPPIRQSFLPQKFPTILYTYTVITWKILEDFHCFERVSCQSLTEVHGIINLTAQEQTTR